MDNVVVRDGDEELSLFLEMRKREKKDQCVSSPLLKLGGNSGDKTSEKSLVSTSCVRLRRSAVEKFLDSENEKSDYEWLLAVPEMEAQVNSLVKPKDCKARSTALKPRVENIPQEPVARSVKACKPVPRLNTSKTAITKQVNTVAEPKPNRKPSRQATPTSRTSLPSTRPPNSARTSNANANKLISSVVTRSSSVGRTVPSAEKSASLTIRGRAARPVSTSRVRANSSGDRSAGRSKISSDDVNPVLMGTQMVERVVNMRKLPPPKHDDKTSSNFGRSLSRSSIDMALRHMNIRRSISGNLRVSISSSTNSIDKNESSPSS